MNGPMYIPISVSTLSTAVNWRVSALQRPCVSGCSSRRWSRWLSGNTYTGPLAYKQARAALRS